MSLGPLADESISALLRNDLPLFNRFVTAELSGDNPYYPNWHTDAINHQLLRIYEGELTKLIITMPPRMGKSELANIGFSMWLLGNRPSLKIAVICYNQALSDGFARSALRVAESHWFREAFPDFRLRRESVSDFMTSEGGGRLSTSVGGMITGRGADLLILDDPTKSDDAERETVRENDKRWYENTFLQRGESDRTRMIIIQQRLHEDDIAGICLREGGCTN